MSDTRAPYIPDPEHYAERVMEAVYQGAYACPQCECTDLELDGTGEYDLLCGGCGWRFYLGRAAKKRHGWPGLEDES